MLRDHVITKPEQIGSYALHQLVEDLTSGGRPLFADTGTHLIIRTESDLTENGEPVREVSEGDILGFELVASCGTKCGGKHVYYPTRNWRARRAWLERRASAAGFEIRALSVTARSEKIERKGRVIQIDRTQFTGILKVTDASAFRVTLRDGVGGPGRAFGRGMIRI